MRCRSLRRAPENDIMAPTKTRCRGVIVKRLSGGRLARLALAAAVVIAGLALTPARADVGVQIGGQRRRDDAIQLADFDRPQQLRHAKRRVPPAIDGAALVLAEVL